MDPPYQACVLPAWSGHSALRQVRTWSEFRCATAGRDLSGKPVTFSLIRRSGLCPLGGRLHGNGLCVKQGIPARSSLRPPHNRPGLGCGDCCLHWPQALAQSAVAVFEGRTADSAHDRGVVTMTTQLPPAIRTSDLTKRFGRIVAVRCLNLSVPLGSISGFLGRNGAGKSTTLKMLMGAVRPSHGSGQIFGLSIDDPVQSVEIRRRVAFVGEDKGLYDYMTVEQIIGFTKSFFLNWRSDLEHKFLRQFPLPFDRKIKKLSKGMRTQLALLLGIARGPEMLVLDEPSEGLDPVAIEILLQLLKNLAAEGVSIFFSSHQLADVEQIADHVFIIDRGELLVGSSVDRLRNECRRIEAVFESPVQENDLAMEGVKAIQAEGKTLSLFVSHNLNRILEGIRTLRATNIEVMPVSLKEIFLQSLMAR